VSGLESEALHWSVYLDWGNIRLDCDGWLFIKVESLRSPLLVVRCVVVLSLYHAAGTGSGVGHLPRLDLEEGCDADVIS